MHSALVQGNLVRDFVKYDDQPYSLESVPESLLRAYRIATTEPKGPVYVCLDADLQEQRISAPSVQTCACIGRQRLLPPILKRSERQWISSLMPSGQSSSPAKVGRMPQALASLRELAEVLVAPVIDAMRFVFPNTHPLDLTAAREQTLRAADVRAGA